MSDNIVSGNKFAFGDPLSASVGVNFNLTVTMPDAYALTGKWATLTVSKFEDGPELFKLSEAGGGLTLNGQNIPVVINNDATNETAGGDTWHTLIEKYRNLRFSLDVGDDSDTSHAEYRFQGDISTDPKRGSLPSGVEVGETVTPTLGGTTINVSLLGQQASSASESSGVNVGDDTDLNGLLYGDGSTLASATAAQIRAAADLDTTDSPTFAALTLTGNINLNSSNVLSVNSAGRVQLDDASGAVVEFSRAYFSGFHGGIRLGATAGDISSDVQIARNSASEIRFVRSDGTTRCDLLADNLTLDGNITLSDGASITSNGSLTFGADGHTLEFAESGGHCKLDFDVSLLINKGGNAQFLFGGFQGNRSHLTLYPSGNNAQDLGISSRRWRTAYFTDIDANGDISLSDGAEINIGSAAGTADILGKLTITADGIYDQAISINGGNITLRNDGAMGCASLTVSTLRNYIHSSGPRVCNANVIGFVDHTTNAVSYSPNAAFSYGNPTNNNDRNGGAVIALGNGTAQDASGTLQLANIKMSGLLNQFTSTTADPTTTEYPNDGDRGIHKNTTSGNVYLAYNDGGSTIVKVQLT